MNELIAENSCNNLLAQPCEKIFSPPHGGMNCSGLVTDATCSFSCEPGYDLVGSQSRTLLQGGAENFLSVKVTAVLLSQESKISGTAHFFLKES